MVELVHTISHRIAKYLEKVGLVQRDMENSYLNLPIDDEDSLLQLQGASVSYRIAMGPQQEQKVFTLQTLPASTEGEYGQLANTSGFSLHAVTSCRGILPTLMSLTKSSGKILNNRRLTRSVEGRTPGIKTGKTLPLHQSSSY